jgi:hypothetical protein
VVAILVSFFMLVRDPVLDCGAVGVGVKLEADDCFESPTGNGRVQLGLIASYPSRLFESLDSLRGCAPRERNGLGNGNNRCSGVGHQLTDDLPVNSVDRARFVGHGGTVASRSGPWSAFRRRYSLHDSQCSIDL